MLFSKRLEAIGFATYSDYLASDVWRAFRQRYRASGKRMTCLVCASKPIQLHHHTYVRLGRERLEDVDPLCRAHHEAVHKWLKESGRFFVEYTSEAIVALGGCAPAESDQPRKVKGVKPAKRLGKAKSAKSVSRRAEGKRLAERLTEQLAFVAARLSGLPLTTKRAKRMALLVETKSLHLLNGLLKCVEHGLSQPPPPKKPKVRPCAPVQQKGPKKPKPSTGLAPERSNPKPWRSAVFSRRGMS